LMEVKLKCKYFHSLHFCQIALYHAAAELALVGS
jgi:hypothetical protein